MPTHIDTTRPVEPGSAWSENENTMRFSAVRSGQVTRARITSRYRDADLVVAARTLCEYLRGKGNQTDLFDRYRCAERALRSTGVIGSSNSSLTEVLYYWVAANDTDPTIVSSVADRRECIVRALHEAQRGNNAGSGYNNRNTASIVLADNRSLPDVNICATGVTNKLAEVLYAMHPDAVLIEDILGLIYDLMRGLIAKHLYTFGKSYDDLKSHDLDLKNKELLPSEKLVEIKALIIEIFGMSDSTTYIGILTQTEVNYIDNCLSDAGLESLTFETCESPSKIQELITTADSMLLETRRLASTRIPVQPSAERSVNVNIRSVKETISNILPDPHWSTYSSTAPALSTSTTTPARSGGARVTTTTAPPARQQTSAFATTWQYTPSTSYFSYGITSVDDSYWRTRFTEQRRTTAELRANALKPQSYFLTTDEKTIVLKERVRQLGI